MRKDELKHYGVLGMKWGVRKADKYAKKSSNLMDRDSLNEWDEIAYYAKKRGDYKAYRSAKLNKQDQINRAKKYRDKSIALRDKYTMYTDSDGNKSRLLSTSERKEVAEKARDAYAKMQENYRKNAYKGGYSTNESEYKASVKMERERVKFMKDLVSEYGSTAITQAQEYDRNNKKKSEYAKGAASVATVLGTFGLITLADVTGHLA